MTARVMMTNNNDNSADDKKVIYDFNEPYANMLEKYRN